ncbi:MAG: glycine oxidase, partial [Actinomycetota bacterium]|nr:glycine oxidase [Actinomycetota bacterium]
MPFSGQIRAYANRRTTAQRAPGTVSTDRESTKVRVAVIGGGVIGLSIAWTLARDGFAVEVFDDQPGLGASWAAAGMLAPVSEVMYEEPELLALGLASLQAWPEFAARLTEASGVDIGLREAGSLLVGFDADDAVALTRAADLLTRHDLENRQLSSHEARALEPALSPRTRSALQVPGDHSLDNRQLLSALLAAAEGAGVRVHEHRVALVTAGGRAVGVRRHDVDEPNPQTAPVHPADLVVLAAGPGSADVPGLP